MAVMMGLLTLSRSLCLTHAVNFRRGRSYCTSIVTLLTGVCEFAHTNIVMANVFAPPSPSVLRRARTDASSLVMMRNELVRTVGRVSRRQSTNTQEQKAPADDLPV